MPRRTRAVCAAGILILALAIPRHASAAPAVTGPHRWEVTVAVRVVPAENGKSVTLRLAAPADGPRQRLLDVELAARGLKPTVERVGEQPHVLFKGKPKGARRIAATYRVECQPQASPVPPVLPLDTLRPELVPFLSPAPMFQSRSILVRDFLETYAGPLLARGDTDPMRAIFEVTRRELARDRKGRSLALDVIRRRQGKRIGIERAFTTFLRCARIPARLVEGVDLASKTRRKRVFWTEVWAQDQWWPVSASRGWIGQLPASYLALARDGTRVLHVDGPATASYTVQTRRLPDDF
jgi:hypothetical protein